MRHRRAVPLALLAALVAAPVHGLDFRDRFSATAAQIGLQGGGAFDALGNEIADTAARNLPVVSASAGFTYRYNPQLEVFERTSDTLGPIFMERSDTLGKGKLNFNVSYESVQMNDLDGTETRHLQGNNGEPIIVRVTDASGALLGFTANQLKYNFKLLNNVVGFSATYGVLDNLDVNLFIPLIATDFNVTATTKQQFVAGPDGVFAPRPGIQQSSKLAGTKNGIGDILLRSKYQLPRWDIWRPALGLQFRLPSGSEGNFQGTGDFEVAPFFYLSTLVWGRVEPHLNLGLDLRTDNVGESDGRYDVGVDADITRRIGLALAFLGRSQFEGSATASETNFLYLTRSGPALKPLLGVQFDRKDYFDFSFGVRAVVWRQIMVFANGIYALNNDGLRNNSVIPVVGLEGTF